MSPLALALAILLHALVVAVLWWLSQQKPLPQPVEEAINVSFEQPKPPDPPPPEPPPQPPAAQPQQVPAPRTLPPIDLGVRPPAPVTGDRPTQAPPTDQVSKEPPAPPPPPESKEEPSLLTQPEVAPPTPAPPVEARVDPPPAPAPTPAPTPVPAEKSTPEPPTEQGLKKAPTPPPPPVQQAAPSPEPPVKPAEPVPTPKPMPQQQALAAPPTPPPPAPKPELKPSPLATAPTRRPPSASSAEPPSQHRFVNPADTYARAKVADNYLAEVLRKIVGYRYQSTTQKRQGVTVVRIVIARDGRLLAATVISSSGEPEFDNGVLAGVRAGAPYSPLPDNIKGTSAPFDLPLVSVRR